MIRETFPDEHIFVVQNLPWFADILNYLVSRGLPPDLTRAQKDKIKKEAKIYVWEEPYLWKYYVDQVIRRCVPQYEVKSILNL